jgi:FkbM family methyltransferase
VQALELKLFDGVTLAVPASLESVTTYALLEQERWFEKEIDFLRCWLRPGMTVIDIGANLGSYSLPMARLVGPTGSVFAYEPGCEARALLDHSRALNQADNLRILPFALSDGERDGWLTHGTSGELNALGNGGPGEPIRITSLDMEDGARGWQPPDLVKIDAEGEEERVLAGGRVFFARHSPLVLFEIKALDKVNDRLRALFPAIGYKLFRQLGGAPVLVPDRAEEPLDDHELNLFAAKPERASALSQQGLLVETLPSWRPHDDHCRKADGLWRSQAFAARFALPAGLAAYADTDYRDGLAAFAMWRAANEPVTVRCSALAFAVDSLRTACERDATAARLSTFARVAWEWGARGEAVAALQRLLKSLQSRDIRLFDQEPFWPAAPRFDHIVPQGSAADWLAAAAAEHFEKSFTFSSMFGGLSPALAWLRQQPVATVEMERRHVLVAARAGTRPIVPPRLHRAAPDHLNAEIWRSGKVPGTLLPA